MTTDGISRRRVIAVGYSLLDVLLVVGTALTAPLVWNGPGVGPGRVLVGTATVILLPGYTLTAAMFPRSQVPTDTGRSADALALVQRIACSVGLSILVVPLLGFLLHFSPWGVTQPSVIRSVAAFTALAGVVAAVRRFRCPPDRRVRLPVGRAVGWLRGTQADGSRYHLVVAVLFLLSVGVAGSAVATTDSGETFTELYLLADDESGEVVADDYPTEIGPNSSETVYVGIENHEARPISYTVFVEWQTFVTADGRHRVVDRSLLGRYHPSLAPGESTRVTQQVTPPASSGGREGRLTVSLYIGDVSGSSAPPEPYRQVHIWIAVPEGGER